MAKVLVLLSGAGKLDGSEIHESVLALLALDQGGATYDICAPDADQADVVNHHTGEVTKGERRNMRVEAGRIARGAVLDVAHVEPKHYDALVMPGGFGAAKNLCSFAAKGADCTVLGSVERLIQGFHKLGKPIGAICIAPALLARVLGKGQLTIGNDKGTASSIEQTGACHVDCAVGDIVVDESLNLVSTPAYMLATRISEVHTGIAKLVKEVLRRVHKSTRMA
ncbi:MAG: isoprenoid biosynthesis glyoxalase ElbB [Planctomycetota bacterium]